MEVVITRCARLNVHKATVVATVRVPGDDGRRRIVTETFGTMTPDLIALREWLQAYGVTQVARESTGVYWKPVYYVLEDAFELLRINMLELKHVPGRKTDVKDSEWLAPLLEYGLLRSSHRTSEARDRLLRHARWGHVPGTGRGLLPAARSRAHRAPAREATRSARLCRHGATGGLAAANLFSEQK